MLSKSTTDGWGGRRRRIGRIVGGLAAVIAVLAGVAVVASAAQRTPDATSRVTNPPPRVGCGLRVLLVLDSSGSIPAAGDQVPAQVRDAATGFVNALNGTGSELAMVKFAQNAYPANPNYLPVNTANANGTFRQFIQGYNPTNGGSDAQIGTHNATNWQAALQTADNTPQQRPDLVLFVTDGNPTTSGIPGKTAGTPGEPTYNSNTTPAVTVANKIKGAGTRVFALGVGDALNDPASKGRLQDISGPNQFPDHLFFDPEHPANSADWTVLNNFDGLTKELQTFVSELCAPSMIITKEILGFDGTTKTAAAGWTFETTVEGANHTWENPDHATDGKPNGPTASKATGEDGVARFEWRLDPPEKHTVSAKEIHKPGFTFVEAQCRTVLHSGGTEESVSYTGIPAAEIGPEDFRTCTVLNRPHAGELTVVKRLEPSDDPGKFNLDVDGRVRAEQAGDQGSTGPITLPLGTHEVSESASGETQLSDYTSSIRCVDLAHPSHTLAETHGHGPLPVQLTSDGQQVQCTITNVNKHFGEITVEKHLVPAKDPGRFNLLIGGEVHAHGVGEAGTTGDVSLPFGAHAITETGANGTNLGHYNISTTCINESTGHTVAHNAHGPSVSVHLNQAADNILCTIENERPGVKVGKLTVVKHLVPADDPGRFDLLIGGKVFAHEIQNNGTTGSLDFELGTHTVTEHGADGTNLADFSISTTCKDEHTGHTVVHDPGAHAVSVPLKSESDNIVCTITNTRTESVPEGKGVIPAVPGPGPHLVVTKMMPSQARVGGKVPVTIVVRNEGHASADGVQVAEERPAGLELVSAADGGTIEPSGTAVWHIGTLAPGESRTVHATARVRHPGLHVDTAVATANNADPALSDASVMPQLAARSGGAPQKPRPAVPEKPGAPGAKPRPGAPQRPGAPGTKPHPKPPPPKVTG